MGIYMSNKEFLKSDSIHKSGDIHCQNGGKYSFIINPKTGRTVNIYGKLGRMILNNYISEYYDKIGGGKNPHTKKKWSSYTCLKGQPGVNGKKITIENCNKQYDPLGYDN